MEINNVCVLGGSGFVGRHVVHMLSERGCAIRVPTRRVDAAKPLLVLPGVTLAAADVHDEAELARLFAGMDAVINLVGILHEHRPGDFRRAHVDLPRKVVAACRAAGVKRVLHMSALGGDTGGLSEYQRTKGQGEALVLAAQGEDLQVTVFRPSVIFGPHDTFLNMFASLLRRIPVFPLGSPGTRFQTVYVEDVARAYAASLANPATFGQCYNLCGPRVYTLHELVTYVARTCGYRRLIVPLNDRLSYAQAWLFDKLPVRLLTLDNYYTLQTDNVCEAGFPAVFGFQPTPLEEVAAEYLAGDTPRAHYRGFRGKAGR